MGTGEGYRKQLCIICYESVYISCRAALSKVVTFGACNEAVCSVSPGELI